MATKTFDPSLETAGKNANIAAIALGIGGTALAITGIIVLVTGDSSVVRTDGKTRDAGCAPVADAVDLRGPVRRRRETAVLGVMKPAPRSTLRSGLRIGWPFAACDSGGGRPARLLQAQHQGRRTQVQPGRGRGKSCPEGFRCDTSTVPPLCWRNPDGGVDRPSSDVADGRVDGTVDMTPDVACFDARPDCTPRRRHVRSVSARPVARLRREVLGQHGRRADLQPAARARFPKTALMTALRGRVAPGRPTRPTTAGPGWSASDGASAVPRCFQFCRSDADCTNVGLHARRRRHERAEGLRRSVRRQLRSVAEQ